MSMEKYIFHIATFGVISLVFLMGIGCLGRDANKPVVVEFGTYDATIDGETVSFASIIDVVSNKVHLGTSVVFAKGENLEHAVLAKIQRQCSALGIYRYSLLLEGAVVPVHFGMIGDSGDPRINERYVRPRNWTNIVIDRDMYFADGKRFSSEAEFHARLEELVETEMAIMFVCDMQSTQKQLLDAINILRKGTAKDFFIASQSKVVEHMPDEHISDKYEYLWRIWGYDFFDEAVGNDQSEEQNETNNQAPSPNNE